MVMTALVVMEPGSDWPGQIGDSMHVVALTHEGEDFLQRTQAKLGTLRRSKTGVRVAVLACNSAAEDGAAVDRRAQVARTLLAALAGTTGGRLILSARGRASHQLRQELFELAGALNEESRGTTTTCSVRFAEASRGDAVRTRETCAPTAAGDRMDG
jgi:hypothetical protein